MRLWCCTCQTDVSARLTSGVEVYPHRPDLADIPRWICDTCKNHVGTHHKTADRTRPLGNIPSPELKRARILIHENYDYVHATNYWTSWGSGTNHLQLRKEALESLLARELRYVGSKYPICSVIRMRKFIKRGWTINAGQVLKMSMQISQLDLTKPEVLEDQLTGVDVAYFHQVIEAVKKDDPNKINCAYLIEIIDRMF